MEYVIQQPKTESGIRYIPMTEEVASCFRRIIANRTFPKAEPMVEGYVGFLFLDKNDMPMVALHWEKYLEYIVQKYNKIYRIQMPKVTPHVCRHTFRFKMEKYGMNPKTLQYIMSHADISVTLNTYTHLCGAIEYFPAAITVCGQFRTRRGAFDLRKCDPAVPQPHPAAQPALQDYDDPVRRGRNGMTSKEVTPYEAVETP